MRSSQMMFAVCCVAPWVFAVCAESNVPETIGIPIGSSATHVAAVLGKRFPSTQTERVSATVRPIPEPVLVGYKSWSDTERVDVLFTLPPNEQIVLVVDRSVTFNAPTQYILESSLVGGLTEKYGEPSRVTDDSYFWFWDSSGMPFAGQDPRGSCEMRVKMAGDAGPALNPDTSRLFPLEVDCAIAVRASVKRDWQTEGALAGYRIVAVDVRGLISSRNRTADYVEGLEAGVSKAAREKAASQVPDL